MSYSTTSNIPYRVSTYAFCSYPSAQTTCMSMAQPYTSTSCKSIMSNTISMAQTTSVTHATSVAHTTSAAHATSVTTTMRTTMTTSHINSLHFFKSIFYYIIYLFKVKISL